MIVNNLQDSVAPRTMTIMADQGPDQASGGNESEHYEEIPECRDLERVRNRENQTLARHGQRSYNPFRENDKGLK